MTSIRSSARQKITVAATLSIYPDRKRYAEQLYSFYNSLARQFDIDLVLLSNNGQKISKREISPGFTEIRVPKSPQHHQAELALRQTLNVPIGDVSIPKLHFLTPKYLEALSASLSDSDFSITSHPYFFPILREISHKPIWYEAHNVEADLKQRVLPKTQEGYTFLKQTREIEAECCQTCELVLTFSEETAQGLSQNYHIQADKMITLPYGVSTANIPYMSYQQRLLQKAELGIKEQFVAIFMGSRHLAQTQSAQSANASTIRSILAIASKLPDVNFLVLGNSGLSFNTRMAPPNVTFMGIVSHTVKSLVFSIADVAINPTESSSASTLTMLDYLSAGIPLVSTITSARLLGLENQKHCLITEAWNFPEALRTLQKEDFLSKSTRLHNARRHVERYYDWNVIADQLVEKINST
jgi:glycosyltransferase involved in cell wall biosynthesis